VDPVVVETLQRICRKKNEICLVVWFVCPVLEKKQREKTKGKHYSH
jgi:hypothetical protein